MVKKVTFKEVSTGHRYKDGVKIGSISCDPATLIVSASGTLEDCNGFDLNQFDNAILCAYMFEQCQIVTFIRKWQDEKQPEGLLADEILLGIPHNMGSQERIKARALKAGYPVTKSQLLQYKVDEWQAEKTKAEKEAEAHQAEQAEAKKQAKATKTGTTTKPKAKATKTGTKVSVNA